LIIHIHNLTDNTRLLKTHIINNNVIRQMNDMNLDLDDKDYQTITTLNIS